MEKPVYKSEITIVGISCRTRNSPEAAPRDIANLWARFYVEGIPNLIPNKSSHEVIALYCDYEGDHTKPYSVVLGCPVEAVGKLPSGLIAKTIPGGSYLRFPAVGEQPASTVTAWEKIWQSKIDRAYSGDYELYGDKFFSQKNQEVEIFISVK